ncbi:uncharacterized protein LOC133189251 [Saccostrea echinata]|uniref:uncharacterized protein LOC133189251 n=1 Tax=Saccostrea echinata TaxID=191078 RepID=UPI002A8131CB|nr:uncharacterized protein LOC133189251 [Saccostrea echinata]
MATIGEHKTHFSGPRVMGGHYLGLEKLDDKDNILCKFEKWFCDKYKESHLVHFYYGKADIPIENIKHGDEVIVAVIDKMKDLKERTFRNGDKDIAVIWKDWKEDTDEVSLGMEEQQNLQIKQIDKFKKIEKYLEENSKDLLKKHSNLEMIMASTYRIKKGKISKEPCIVLYCSCKGVVPINEAKFPTTIHEIKTDVREGFFHLECNFNGDVCAVSKDLLNPLRMGASIGKEGEQIEGTLGGFVKSNDEFGFITCAHNFYGPDEMETPELPKTPITVVQPSHEREGSQECGKTVRSVSSFSNVNEENITVDATFVRLTERCPEQLFFADLFTARLKNCGFSRATFPRYISGTPLDLREDEDRESHLLKKYLKCGTTTGLTMGYLHLDLFRGRLRDCRFSKSTKNLQHKYYQKQLIIEGENFSMGGDSGSFVFQVREDHILDCIGMLVGRCGKYRRAVTPIIPVLNALNASLIPFP